MLRLAVVARLRHLGSSRARKDDGRSGATTELLIDLSGKGQRGIETDVFAEAKAPLFVVNR
jgi:hypothetical protein